MGWTAPDARRGGPLLVLAVGLVAAVGACAGESDAAEERCRTVEATIVTSFVECGKDFDSPVHMCTVGRVEGERELEGTTRFRALAVGFSAGMPAVEAETTLSYSGELELTTESGTLVLRDVGVIDQVDATFTELQRITRGDGTFERSRGTLFASGVLTGGGFQGTLTGQLCLVR
jgi:hypothetical protein